MKVAVVGGAGVAGSYAVEALRDQGHSVTVIGRRTGVDVSTGDGLDRALAGSEVVIDAVNKMSQRRSVIRDFFETTARRLQSAASAQGVGHIVLLSIVGIDRVRGYAYYDAKLAQESATTAGDVATTVLRATQFHEFPAQLLQQAHLGRLAFAPHMRSQPVAARTVGRHLARLASERPGGIVELAGPEVHDVPDLARRYVQARKERLHVFAVTLPGKASHDMRTGAILPGAEATIDGPTYDEWLCSEDARRLPLIRGKAAPASGPHAATTR